MKKIIQLSLLTLSLVVWGQANIQAQTLPTASIQQFTPATTSVKNIQLKPGTAKHLPVLFMVATKTKLFLNLAGELNLSAEQRGKLEELHQELQSKVGAAKANYDKQNEGLQTILSQDNIELETMKANLVAAEQLKAEMQYCLFESLVKAANILTPEQQQQIVRGVQSADTQ